MATWMRVLGQLGSQLRDAADHLDGDVALQASMAACIEAAATRYALEPGARWQPGEPLRLLFAGYAGTRNTGADVRVEEMVRQVRHLLGDDLADLSILTIDPARSQGYFKTVKQLHLPQVFPRFLVDTVHQQHGVIACEGSMFKSKFANALSTLMVGALGLAAAENKIAVGYGGEAGAMDPSLERLVARYCRDALIITRNRESQQVLGRLGVPTELGTDTAWTFEPHPPDVGRRVLADQGWDGTRPVLVVCPINPFWWPVKPDMGRSVARLLSGGHDRAHYSSIYFHADAPEVHRKQEAYLQALATGIGRYSASATDAPYVAVVGMEALDRAACEALAARLGVPHGIFVADEHDHRTMVSLLRASQMLLSSRYHAIVCSMPGLVPSAGVTMDERIRNLMIDRGTPELALTVEDPALAEGVHRVLERLAAEGEALSAGIGRCVVKNLERMGHMGGILVDHLRARHPELPLRPELGRHGDPWAHLPPLSSALERIVEAA